MSRMNVGEFNYLQTMRNLGRNMAFLIKAINSLKEAEGIPAQEHEAFTNFIR